MKSSFFVKVRRASSRTRESEDEGPRRTSKMYSSVSIWPTFNSAFQTRPRSEQRPKTEVPRALASDGSPSRSKWRRNASSNGADDDDDDEDKDKDKDKDEV